MMSGLWREYLNNKQEVYDDYRRYNANIIDVIAPPSYVFYPTFIAVCANIILAHDG